MQPTPDAASPSAWKNGISVETGDKPVTEPVVVNFRDVSEGPFGPNGIPHDIFVSSDPVYMRAPVKKVGAYAPGIVNNFVVKWHSPNKAL